MSFTIEERIARLEGALGIGFEQRILSRTLEGVAALFVCAGIATAYLGVGFPNHYYQPVFALLCLGLGYHREWILFSGTAFSYLLAFGNLCIATAVMKIFLGAGFVQPFAWIRVPDVQAARDVEGVARFVPQFSLHWTEVSLSQVSIDLTVIQTFLLIISLIGGFFGFQPFASLTAFVLVLLSIPALLAFNWTWVLPTLIIAAVGLYLQTGTLTNKTTALPAGRF